MIPIPIPIPIRVGPARPLTPLEQAVHDILSSPVLQIGFLLILALYVGAALWRMWVYGGPAVSFLPLSEGYLVASDGRHRVYRSWFRARLYWFSRWLMP